MFFKHKEKFNLDSLRNLFDVQRKTLIETGYPALLDMSLEEFNNTLESLWGSASEKIKSAVTAAASQAGFSPDEASNTAMKVLDSVIMAFGDREEVPTSEIKGKVLSDLDTMAPEVLAAWKQYEEARGK